MTESSVSTYRARSLDARREAQSVLAAFRAERAAKRKAAAKPRNAPANKPTPSSAAARDDSFSASPETIALMGEPMKPSPRKAAASSRTPRKTSAAAKAKVAPNVEAEVKDTVSKLSAALGDLQAAEKRKSKLDQSLEKAEARLAKANEQRDRAEADKAKLREKVETERTSLRVLKEEHASLKLIVREAEKDAKTLTAKSEKLSATVENLDTEVSTKTAALDSLKAEIGALTEELQDRQTEVETVRADLAELTHRRDTTAGELDTLSQETQQLSSEGRTLNDYLADLKEEIEQGERRNALLLAEKKATESALAGTIASFTQERRKLETLRLEITDLEGCDDLSDPLADLSDDASNPTSDLLQLPDMTEGLLWHLEQAGIKAQTDLLAAGEQGVREGLGALAHLVDIAGWIDAAQGRDQKA